jgi:hypothetical protein
MPAVDQDGTWLLTPAGGPIAWILAGALAKLDHRNLYQPMNNLDSSSPFMKGPKRKRLAKVYFIRLFLSSLTPPPQACDACHKSKRRCDGTGMFRALSFPFSLNSSLLNLAPCSNW